VTTTAPASAVVHATGDMSALVFRGTGRAFELIAVPEVDLHAGEALVSVELATICGSDLHTIDGVRHADVPLVLGHEQVGRVVALGPGRPARTIDGRPLAPGIRVVWGVAVDCGRCRYCRAGIPQKCATLRKYGHERMTRGWELSGGFASHVHLLARTPIVEVADDLPAEMLAPASCATATVMAAFAAAAGIRPLAGATVAISGCGMLGLTAVAVAVDRGATVIASDPDPERRAAALRFGATATADGTLAGWQTAFAKVPSARHGYTVALELSGAPAAVQHLILNADIGAVLVLVGSVFPAGTVPIDPETTVRGMLTIRGVHNYAPEHLLEAVRFLGTADRAAFSELVGSKHPITDIAAALTAAHARSGARTGLRPSR
jgi:putative phosphonate catabolism associated alcohol dehydrogenase